MQQSEDVSHGDNSSDGYVLAKQVTCQGTFPNAHFAGKLQTDHVWEGGRGGKPPCDSNGEGSPVLPPAQAGHIARTGFEVTQIIWYHLPMHCTKLLKVL